MTPAHETPSPGLASPGPAGTPARDLPPICGHEHAVAAAMARTGPFYLPDSDVGFERVQSAFAVALHMHQPLIPAGPHGPGGARVISNLQHMLENPNDGDNHNATVFLWCYERMAEFVRELVREGKRPRVMLDYSGCLLHGLRLMGRGDIIESLARATRDPETGRCLEWLGTPWGHAVAPSTPPQDYRLHVRAWQQQFAEDFGYDALSRVRGFSPAEMALPNHPDVFYEFVRTLKDCGFRWVLVQEHTVERLHTGQPLEYPHLPHRLVARSSAGEELAITAIVKTRGSDTKLVGQMQPFYEALHLQRVDLAGRSVPPVVTQISDGENGNVIMNEFPSKYLDVSAQASGQPTCPVNITEYLEYLDTLGVREDDFPSIQPALQHRLWSRFKPGEGGGGPERLAEVIDEIRREDPGFSMEGGSWTSDVSWVRGYESLLGPMESTSRRFAEATADGGLSAKDDRYREALYHMLTCQTSCFRYWGQGQWTDFGRELCRRSEAALTATAR